MCMIIAAPAQAGAWLRDPGKFFFSASATGYRTDSLRDYKLAAYGEWGVSEKLTLGLDLNEYGAVNGHAMIFVRLPLGQAGEFGRFAAELGLGKHQILGEWHRMYKATVSYGRSFRSDLGNGWLAVDAAQERRFGLSKPFWKSDLTAGLSTDRTIDPLLQIETSYLSGTSLIWSVIPSIMIRARGNTAWLIGVEKKSAFPDAFGLKLGFWRSF